MIEKEHVTIKISKDQKRGSKRVDNAAYQKIFWENEIVKRTLFWREVSVFRENVRIFFDFSIRFAYPFSYEISELSL